MTTPIGSNPLPPKECYDNPEVIYKERICLLSLSKNVQGKLSLISVDTYKCGTPSCKTLKSLHEITLELEGNDPCEDKYAPLFGGKITIARLATAFNEDGLQRGVHAADIKWDGPGAWGSGRISGVTNAGTHRDPVLSCEDCYSPGHMEGRICAHFDEVDVP